MTILEVISKAIKSKTPMCISMHSNKSDLKTRIHYILSNGQIKKSICLMVSIVLITFSLFACSSIQLKENTQLNQLPSSLLSENSKNTSITDNSQPNTEVTIKNKTNILIVGIDDISHADIILIASFDSNTNQVNLLSVPRDTYFKLSENTVLDMKKKGLDIPSELKLGEVTVYAQTYGMEYLKTEIINNLDIPIDYYIKMDINAFKKIIDAVGGVEMEIPKNGLYYSDPFQNLEINLEEGSQLLDGEKAIMFVRYRGYKNGDLERISVQQQLIKELYKKIINSKNLLQKSSALLSILIENTETDLLVTDLALYGKYLPKMNGENFQIITLPINTERINSRLYTVIDKEKYRDEVVEIFK